jgi:transposase InsO family protein
VHNIIRRNGLLGERERPCVAPLSFERAAPNELWQMDFKGHFEMAGSKRCHPLTACDDHSRFNLILKACEDERTGTVQDCLLSCFGSYGLPWAVLCDNGSPWGRREGMASSLELWLLRLGVETLHGRPRHPQTQGKEERFHQTLKREVLSKTTVWRDIGHCDGAFAEFRELYNHVRPHRSLDLDCPGERYRASERRLPASVPSCLSFYGDAELVRKVKAKGEIMFKNRTFTIGRAFVGESVAINQFDEGSWEVFYCWKSLGIIDLSEASKPKNNYNQLLPSPRRLGVWGREGASLKV